MPAEEINPQDDPLNMMFSGRYLDAALTSRDQLFAIIDRAADALRATGTDADRIAAALVILAEADPKGFEDDDGGSEI